MARRSGPTTLGWWRCDTLTSGPISPCWPVSSTISRRSPASAVSPKSVWLREGDVLETAVTHGEGKFVAPAATLDRLEAAGQVAFRYVDGNPNGSLRDIAGICDPTGRVLGLMPHPEKHQDPTNHPRWTRRGPREPDGSRLFRAAFEHLKSP